MMRALIAMNVLARREELTLFVAVHEGADPGGRRVANALADARRLATVALSR